MGTLWDSKWDSDRCNAPSVFGLSTAIITSTLKRNVARTEKRLKSIKSSKSANGRHKSISVFQSVFCHHEALIMEHVKEANNTEDERLVNQFQLEIRKSMARFRKLSTFILPG